MFAGLRKKWRDQIGQTKTILGEKVREALASVVPITLIVLIWMYARFFSKHYDRRRAENARYLKLSAPLRRSFSTLYLRLRDGRSYRYYDCPGCHQRLRVPKGKGQITVTCPKCHTKFDAKS